MLLQRRSRRCILVAPAKGKAQARIIQTRTDQLICKTLGRGRDAFGEGSDVTPCHTSPPCRVRTMSAKVDSLRGSSVRIGTMQRRLAWPLRKDDTHKWRGINMFFVFLYKNNVCQGTASATCRAWTSRDAGLRPRLDSRAEEENSEQRKRERGRRMGVTCPCVLFWSYELDETESADQTKVRTQEEANQATDVGCGSSH